MTQPNTETPKIDVDEKLNSLETFIARRFDEISMEIEATSQLMEMAEEDAGKRFTDMLGMLNAISFSGGDGSSAANSGAELEAVVSETEKAATRIMDSADKISNTLTENEELLSGDMHLATVSETIFLEIQNIMMACEFQDLVSQRVTNSLKNIREIQERLDTTLSKFGIDTSKAKETKLVKDHTNDGEMANVESASSQDDIDALFD